MTRQAFSLLEVIIATAVLAASAMVLTSLISLGSKFGNRAEERTLALSDAESLLNEFLAKLNVENGVIEESTGELPVTPLSGAQPKSFRISTTSFPLANENPNGAGESMGQLNRGLLRVTVEVFESSGSPLSAEARPLVELTRLIRPPHPATEATSNVNPSAFGTDTNPLYEGFTP